MALFDLEAEGKLSYAANINNIRGTTYEKKLPKTKAELQREKEENKRLIAFLESL